MAEIPTPYDHLAEQADAYIVGEFAVIGAIKAQHYFREGWTACMKAVKATGVEWGTGELPHCAGFCRVCGAQRIEGHLSHCRLAAIPNGVKEKP